MDESLFWLAGGLVLLVAEALVPGVFLIWIGLAALGTGVVVQVFDPSFAVKAIVFAALAGGSVSVALRLRRVEPRRERVVNSAESGLVGRSVQVLSFSGREGRVRLGDSDWQARVPEGAAPPEAGAQMQVTGVAGTVLIISPPS